MDLRGFKVYKGYLGSDEQLQILDDLRRIQKKAPLYSPQTPTGKPMSVRMTSAGRLGWISDAKGYRYAAHHPSGVPWPDIPGSILQIWKAIGAAEAEPECCLVNFYGEGARMGMHQDRDEADFRWPVVSVSLGDDGLFRVGSTERSGATESLWLSSGDVVVMGGDARLKYHGVDRIRFGSSRLLKQGGRINLTLRVVR
ncbi:MAG: alpha-ketoglutarate-dependent dioxygenase AlkB [Pseudoruegeria sp.]